MTKLNVPYRSQWDTDADKHSADCGPTCLAMMLNYLQISMTPDAVYNYNNLPEKKDGDYTNFTDLARVARANDLQTTYSYKPTSRQPVQRAAAFKNLFANIDAGKPMLVLVSYAPWRKITGNQFSGPHFVVVSGYDDANIYIHDPLFGTWVPRARGAYYAMSHDLFASGWGGLSGDNTNWSWLTIETKGVAPTPPPAPVVVAPSKVETETAVSTPVTDDTERRIRSLAAYRWTEPPNFDNAADVKLWQDHLGDFASTYETYAVQPGNTLSGLASKFYGAQGRWPVIKTFNKLEREGLWAGEKLKIPNLGQSGAGSDSALPQNTIDKAKAFDPFTDIVDPDSPAQDYSALVGNTAGLTDYEED